MPPDLRSHTARMGTRCRALTGRPHWRCHPRSVKQTVTLSNNAPTSLMGGTTWYLHGENNALIFEKELKANGMTFALVTTRSGAGVSNTASDLSKRSAQVRYFHQDHLNSMAVVTDEAGQVVERLAYDPWGKRRNANGLADTSDSLVGQTTDRGYTEHERLDEVGLIHMNGRVYDPLIGRFMSADPFIQSAGNLQSYNRYAYVMNNPLAMTDPSGYWGLGSLLRSIDNFRRDVIRETGKAINTVLSPLQGWAQGVAMGAASVFGCGPAAPACLAYLTGTAAYGAGASSSDALRAGAIAGGTAYAFSWAGDVYASNPAAGYAAHAAVGCASSVASGGNCAQGAAAAVFGKFATVTIGGTPGQFNGYQMVATMVAGGVGSVIAGGKFENGAATAAFGYLFNELMHQTSKAQRGYGESAWDRDQAMERYRSGAGGVIRIDTDTLDFGGLTDSGWDSNNRKTFTFRNTQDYVTVRPETYNNDHKQSLGVLHPRNVATAINRSLHGSGQPFGFEFDGARRFDKLGRGP